MTLIGTSIYGQDISPTLTDLRPQMVRVYDDLGKAAQIAKAGIPLAFSLQTFDADRVNAALKVLPPGSTISVKHEPEDDVEAKTLTLDTWRSWQTQLVAVVKKSGRSDVRVATILMSWTLEKASGRSWSDYLTPAVVAALKTLPGSICGWDAYAGPTDALTKSPTQIYGPGKTIANQLGLAWGVFETGIRITKTSDLIKQVTWWQDAFTYARANAGYCFLLWNSPPNNQGPSPDFTFYLGDRPALCKCWKDAAAGSTPVQPPPPKTYSQAELDAAVAAATKPLADELADEHAYGAQLETEITAATEDLAIARDALTAADQALTVAQAATVAASKDAAEAEAALRQAAVDAQAAQVLAIAQEAIRQQALAAEHLRQVKTAADDMLMHASADIAGILWAASTRRAKCLAAVDTARAGIKALA